MASLAVRTHGASENGECKTWSCCKYRVLRLLSLCGRMVRRKTGSVRRGAGVRT